MQVKIYHNPRCSKSREALRLIRERGIEPTVIEYQKTPPSAEELERLLTLLGKEPREIMRTQDALYQEASLDDPGLVRETLVRALAQRPALLERPIVVVDDRQAVLARPPEKVLDVLPDA
ncbi:MAG: arsenate reductase (glutaredoxin) [Pseudomonadota bacterium]